jgi:hypothetical protein
MWRYGEQFISGRVQSVQNVHSEDFESGLGGYTIDNSYGVGGGLWHLTSACESPMGAHTTTHSLYYGVDPQCDYDAGDTQGVVTSPVISLAGASPPIILSFNYFLETEGDPQNFDVVWVDVSKDGGPFTFVAHNDPSVGVVVLADPSMTQRSCKHRGERGVAGTVSDSSRPIRGS